ncbi:MAG: hypothetical protein V1838_02050 [Patescibacteria group bacterium]
MVIQIYYGNNDDESMIFDGHCQLINGKVALSGLGTGLTIKTDPKPKGS